MTIETKLETIQDCFDDIKDALIAKGYPPSGDITTYASAVNSIPSGEQEIGIPREVVNGVYSKPVSSFSFKLPNEAISIGEKMLSSTFSSLTNLTSVDLSSLTSVSGTQAMSNAFFGCTGLTGILDLSSLTTVSGSSAMSSAFSGCTGLTGVDLSNLTTVGSGNNIMSNTFYNCTSLTGALDLSNLTTIEGSMFCTFKNTSLTSVNLSKLTTVSGSSAMSSTFIDCTSLTSVDLSSLTTISGSYAMQNTFKNCTSLTTLSFPSLTSAGVGTNSTYSNTLSGVTGCTVHFPSNLQSVIGSWTNITKGLGGTNTTVLFDLTATT